MIKKFFKSMMTNSENTTNLERYNETREKIKKIKTTDDDFSKYFQKFDYKYDKDLGLEYFRFIYRKITPENYKNDFDKMLDNYSKNDDEEMINSCYFSVMGAFEYFFSELIPYEKNLCLYYDSKLKNVFTINYQLIAFIKNNPEVKQSELYSFFPEVKKDNISSILSSLASKSIILQEKEGKTYRLKFNKMKKDLIYNNYSNELIKNDFNFIAEY